MNRLEIGIFVSFLFMLFTWVLAFGYISPLVHLIPELVLIFLIGVYFGEKKAYVVMVSNIIWCITIPLILAYLWILFVIIIIGVFASSSTIGFILGLKIRK